MRCLRDETKFAFERMPFCDLEFVDQSDKEPFRFGIIPECFGFSLTSACPTISCSTKELRRQLPGIARWASGNTLAFCDLAAKEVSIAVQSTGHRTMIDEGWHKFGNLDIGV